MSTNVEAEALYKAMNVMDLVLLRHAFLRDLHEARGRDLDSARFCQHRIDTITRELTARHQRVLAAAHTLGQEQRGQE